jgi:hypothetical protein
VFRCFSRQDNHQQVQESENQGTNKSLGRSIYKAKSSGTSQSGDDDTTEPNGDMIHMLITVSFIFFKIVTFWYITRKLIYKSRT